MDRVLCRLADGLAAHARHSLLHGQLDPARRRGLPADHQRVRRTILRGICAFPKRVSCGQGHVLGVRSVAAPQHPDPMPVLLQVRGYGFLKLRNFSAILLRNCFAQRRVQCR